MRRVVEEGPYECTLKYSLILAVRPVGPPWYRFSKDAGTTSHVFSSILEEKGHARSHLPFHIDACQPPLSPHRRVVTNTVHQHPGGHRILLRSPCRPRDGPVEYANNRFLTKMRVQSYNIATVEDKLTYIIPSLDVVLTGMRETFEMCGY